MTTKAFNKTEPCTSSLAGSSAYRPRISRRRSMAGWTLIELSVVVAVIAVLSVLGLNALRDTTRRMASGGALDELYSVLQVVRREARVRSVPVVLQFGIDDNYDDDRLRYDAFVVPTFTEGSTPDPPEDENDLSWISRGVLPPEVGWSSPEVAPDIPRPFDSFLEEMPCSFSSTGSGNVQITFLSDDSVSLGLEPEKHRQGGSFVLGRTGGVHRFVR